MKKKMIQLKRVDLAAFVDYKCESSVSLAEKRVQRKQVYV